MGANNLDKNGKPKLNRRQKKFVDEYVKDFNGARAATEAGYSENACRQIAHENLTKPYIFSEIEKRTNEQALKAGITQELVLERIKRWLLVDDDNMAPVSLKAAELAMRYLGMNKDKLDLSVQHNHKSWIKQIEAEIESEKVIEGEVVEK